MGSTVTRILTVLVAMFVLALAGCAERAPTASTTDGSTEIGAERAVVSFVSTGPAGKTLGLADADDEDDSDDEDDADDEDDSDDEDDADDGDGSGSLTVSGVIGPDGGKLQIKDKGGKGGGDDLKVKFTVPKGSVAEDVEITMSIEGRSLSELRISFTPTGITFDPPARLQVQLGNDLIDLAPEDLQAIHTHGNGKRERANMSVDHKPEKNIKLEIAVFGFSRYSLGD